jgi:hypothetical protein
MYFITHRKWTARDTVEFHTVYVYRDEEDFHEKLKEITGLDMPSETVLNEWNAAHRREDGFSVERVRTGNPGRSFAHTFKPEDEHTVMFAGKDKQEIARRVKEWIKKEENLYDLIEIRNTGSGHGEELFNKALDLLRRDYIADVDGVADELIEEMLSDSITDEETLDERRSEHVDGTQRVMFTIQAKAGLLVSSNDGAGLEEGLIDTSEWAKNGIEWSKLMYAALEADVRGELDRREQTVQNRTETEDPLERFCEWEEEDASRSIEGDGEEEYVLSVGTIEHGGETYIGKAEGREKALTELRRDYDEKRAAARAAQQAKWDAEKAAKA